jgi:hypothetical protein
MTIKQTVEIPASHRLFIDVPREIPAGPVILSFTPAPSASGLDSRLQGAVDPAMYGKGEITGDIIGPFYNAWDQGN